MGDSQIGMQSVSTDTSHFWTEVRASNAGLNTVPNAENLFVFDPATVSMGRQIGEGGQGCIYEAKFYAPFSFKPHPVIVKKLKPLEGVSQGHFPKELFGVQGNFACRPFGVVYKEKSLCIIMKKYSSDLRTHIDCCMKELRDEQYGYDGPPFPIEVAEYIMLQLAMGLKTLHELGIYHKDLKAANILVTRYLEPDGKRRAGFDVTIADFERSEGVVGTGFYRAPEVLQSLRTRVRLTIDQWVMADIYSFGMICYEVLTGRFPFDDHPVYDYDLVLGGGRPELPNYVPEFLKDIIQRCWLADANSRPCWTDIILALTQNFDGDRDMIEAPLRGLDHWGGLESLAGASDVESMIMELRELILVHQKELIQIGAGGFVDHAYWALEFVSTASEYASKFDVESRPEHPSLCKPSEFLERLQLVGLLRVQVLGCTYAIHACKCQQNMDRHMNVDVKSCSVVFMLQAQDILFSLIGLMGRIQEVQDQVMCGEDTNDPPHSWFSKLLFYRTVYRQIFWIELTQSWTMLPDMITPIEDRVQVLLFQVCLQVLVLFDIYLLVLAEFTYEPILLGFQYGLYRIWGRKKFSFPSSGYLTYRLQRAWMNYTRYKPLSITLIVSLVYLFSSYGWKGILGWTVFPYVLRLTVWRGWLV